MQRWGGDVPLALACVKREGTFVPVLFEQGQCVINCEKKYREQLRTLQRYSLGKEWRAKREEIRKMAVKFHTSLRRGMFKKWPRSIYENRTKKWAAISLTRWTTHVAGQEECAQGVKRSTAQDWISKVVYYVCVFCCRGTGAIVSAAVRGPVRALKWAPPSGA